jgi:hypothetical protein
MTNQEIDAVVGSAVDKIKLAVDQFVNANKKPNEDLEKNLAIMSQNRDNLLAQVNKLSAEFDKLSQEKELNAGEVARLKAEIEALKPAIVAPVAKKPGFLDRVTTAGKNYFTSPIAPGSQETRWDALKRRFSAPAKKLASSHTMNTSEWVNVYFNMIEGLSIIELKEILKENGISRGRIIIESAGVEELYDSIRGILRNLAEQITSQIKTNFKKVRNSTEQASKSFTQVMREMNKEELLNTIGMKSTRHVGGVVAEFIKGLPEDRIMDGVKEICKLVLEKELGKNIQKNKFEEKFKEGLDSGMIGLKKTIKSVLAYLAV